MHKSVLFSVARIIAQPLRILYTVWLGLFSLGSGSPSGLCFFVCRVECCVRQVYNNGAELHLGGGVAFEALCREELGPPGLPIQAVILCLQ